MNEMRGAMNSSPEKFDYDYCLGLYVLPYSVLKPWNDRGNPNRVNLWRDPMSSESTEGF